jgi:hypothetical protein
MDFCKIMAGIEANPLAPVPSMTMRDFLNLRDHVI